MKIRISSGGYTNTCTSANNLTENQMTVPAVRDILEVAERRMLTTMIVSGVTDNVQMNDSKYPTKIGTIPDGKLIGDSAYRYRVMGRIQRKTIINSVVGTPQTDGTFTLSLHDNQLYEGMVVRFYDGTQARLMANLQGSAGNYIGFFKTTTGNLFVEANTITPQPGEKTCFGGGTNYAEGSLAGYGRAQFPDMYINHLTTQRKTSSMTGDALSQVTWLGTDANPKMGWYYAQEAQEKNIFRLEDEDRKWFGQSTMRDSFGNLLAQPSMVDGRGMPIIAGDGIIEQIRGSNDMSPSGSDGFPTIDDYQDMMTQLEKTSNMIFGNIWYVVTGTDGYASAQNVLRDFWVNGLGGRNENENGSEFIEVGNLFSKLKLNGNTLVFVKNVQWDDAEKFPARGNDGKLVQSGMFVFLNQGQMDGGTQNIEILAKGANGANRSMISYYLNGATGTPGTQVSEADSKSLVMLKQDGIFIYNTISCGLMQKPIAA